VAQDEAHATYAHKLTKQEAQLDWQRSAREIERKIRAFNPWPVAYTHWQGKRLRLWQAQALGVPAPMLSPGSVIQINKNGLDVATGDGVLRLLRLQRPGGKPLDVAAMLNACGIQTGQQFS
jgi:methionyl-tRNA formyltransferase